MQKNKPVHCINCSKIIFVINEGIEFRVDCKCGNCGTRQEVELIKNFDVVVKSKGVEKSEEKFLDRVA